MSLLDILGAPFAKVVDAVGNLIDKNSTTAEEKLQAKAELQRILNSAQAEINRSVEAEMNAKRDVLVAELNQGDDYTKRARPTVVYAGLVVLGLNHIILPWVAFFAGLEIPSILIPSEFWWGWSGIVTTWVIGRTAEKRGIRNKVVQAVVGSGGIGV